MNLSRLLTGVINTAKLLSPNVRRVRAWTRGREKLIDASSEAALAGRPWLAQRGYGEGFDERVVEYPWLFEHLGQGELLLDVGSTLNHPKIITLVLSRHRRLVFLNPYRDDGQRSDAPGVRYVRSDVRAASVRGGLSLVTCLSVLEHIGCDNTGYGAGSAAITDAPRARADAMRAMRSLLRPGGRLLLTVPFGKLEDHRWFVQLNQAALEDAISAFGPSVARRTFFLRDGGWRTAVAEECRDAGYNQPGPAASAIACVELTA